MKICPKCSDEYIQMDKHYMKMARARNKKRIKLEEAQAKEKARERNKERIKLEEAQAKEKAREREQIALKSICRKCRSSVAYLNGYCWECYKMEKNA